MSGGTSINGILTNGSFQSDTGTGLNIRVDWSVVSDNLGTKTLEVQVSSLSYSLSSIELASGVELTVNGAVYIGKSAAVRYDGKALISTPLASFSIPNLSGTVKLTAVWHFNGSYSGTARVRQVAGRVRQGSRAAI